MTRVAFPDGPGFEVLKDTLQVFVDDPNRLHMGSYLADRDRVLDASVCERQMGHPWPKCGTVGCLAGIASLIADPGEKGPNAETGLRALGLSTDHEPCECGSEGCGFEGSLTDPVAAAMNVVFGLAHLPDYAALLDALDERFTFPQPLPGQATA